MPTTATGHSAQTKMDTGPMKDNIFGSEAFILLTKMEMHYRRNEFTNFLQNLALDAHDGLYRKSTLAFIRHCSRVGALGGNDKLVIDKGGNLPEKVENHCSRSKPMAAFGRESPTSYSTLIVTMRLSVTVWKI